ncbi:hypothetical protein ACRBEV_17320 [Methylobacterium phyllosphaerae]
MTDARETAARPNRETGPRAPETPPPRSERLDVPTTLPGEDPEVGVAQKGHGEDAIVRRETEI